MAKVICKFCSAENEDTRERCFSCNAPLPKSSALSVEDEKSLENFIQSTEKSLLSAKSKADTVTFSLFFLIAIFWVIASFAAYRNFKDERVMVIVLSIVMGIVAFIFFGGLIGHFERKAMRKAFNEKILQTISEYLKATGYTSADFQYVCGKVLTEKSPLLSFLNEI